MKITVKFIGGSEILYPDIYDIKILRSVIGLINNNEKDIYIEKSEIKEITLDFNRK